MRAAGLQLRGARSAAMLGLLASFAIPAGPGLCEEPVRGDPAARLPSSEHASDVWDLTVALDDGHWIVAQITISNLGPGDRTGAAVGHVLAPGGETHEFHKLRSGGGWQLSPDRRRIDLDSIIFDQSGNPARFYVSKKRLDLDLWIDLSGERAWSPALTGEAYGFDLLAMAAKVRGTFRLPGALEPRSVHGRAILTHRWMDALEARWVEQRVELFGLEDGAGLYLTEVTAPGGESRRWLVVGREGRIIESTDRVELDPAGTGSLTISSASATGRLGIDRELLRDEPLLRAPWLARWWVGRLTRPRFVWTSAPFELTVAGAHAEGLRLAGRGLLGVARFDAGEVPPANPSDLWGVR